MIQVYWITQTLADLPADTEWLAANELAYLPNLRFERRRKDWMLGRWTAKRALVAYSTKTGLSIPASDHLIEISRKESGMPVVLIDGEPLPVALSFSHRNQSSLCALAPAGTRLGADLEFVEPHSKAFMEDYFTDLEKEIFKREPESEHPFLSSLMWSTKEAALKALEVGLSVDTRSVEVISLEQQQVTDWRSLSIRQVNSDQVFHGWWRQEQEFLFTIVSAPPPAQPLHLF
jgi:4'-phosphopantetheinyl transferase